MYSAIVIILTASSGSNERKVFLCTQVGVVVVMLKLSSGGQLCQEFFMVLE